MATWNSGKHKFQFYCDHENPQTRYFTWTYQTTADMLRVIHNWGHHTIDGEMSETEPGEMGEVLCSNQAAFALYKTIRHWLFVYEGEEELEKLDAELLKQIKEGDL